MDQYFNRARDSMSRVYQKANHLISKGTDKLATRASGQMPRIYRKVVGTRPDMITPERRAWLKGYQKDVKGSTTVTDQWGYKIPLKAKTQNRILYGPSNMAYFEIPALKKKIIILGEAHTPRDPDEKSAVYGYGMKEFTNEIFQKGMKKRKCIDFFLEDSYTPGKEGRVVNSWFRSSKDVSNSMQYLRYLFRDCLELDNGICKFADGKYPNVRYQRWDIRQVYLIEKIFFQKYPIACNDAFYILAYIADLIYSVNKEECKRYVLELLSFIYGITHVSDEKKLIEKIINYYNIYKESLKILYNKTAYTREAEESVFRKFPTLVSRCLEIIRKVITKQIDKHSEYIKREKQKVKTSLLNYFKDFVFYHDRGFSFSRILLAVTDLYLFCRMFRKFSRSDLGCDENQDISHIIVYGGNHHTENLINMIEKFYPKGEDILIDPLDSEYKTKKYDLGYYLVYMTELKESYEIIERKFVQMVPDQDLNILGPRIQGFDDLIERFLS